MLKRPGSAGVVWIVFLSPRSSRYFLQDFHGAGEQCCCWGLWFVTQIPHLDLVSWGGRENSQVSVQTLGPGWILGLVVPGGEISVLGVLGIPNHGSVCSDKAEFTQEHEYLF